MIWPGLAFATTSFASGLPCSGTNTESESLSGGMAASPSVPSTSMPPALRSTRSLDTLSAMSMRFIVLAKP